jgi:hypothetical protein
MKNTVELLSVIINLLPEGANSVNEFLKAQLEVNIVNIIIFARDILLVYLSLYVYQSLSIIRFDRVCSSSWHKKRSFSSRKTQQKGKTLKLGVVVILRVYIILYCTPLIGCKKNAMEFRVFLPRLSDEDYERPEIRPLILKYGEILSSLIAAFGGLNAPFPDKREGTYIYIYIYIYIYVYPYICISIYMYIHIQINVCSYIRL